MGIIEDVMMTPGVLLCFAGLAFMGISLILVLYTALTSGRRRKKIEQKLSERY